MYDYFTSRLSSGSSTQSLASNKHEEDDLSTLALSSAAWSSSSHKITVPGVRKASRYEKDWPAEETVQLVNLWSVQLILSGSSIFEFIGKILKNWMN